MKRADSKRAAKRSGDIKKDFSQAQLAWIGSVALAYNEAEILVDFIIQIGLRLFPVGDDVTGRINGVDGKIAIAKIVFERLKASDQIQHMVADTLGNEGFSLFKKFRDRIIHARIMHAEGGIGKAPANRGQFEEILLSEKALSTLYDRIDLVRQELLELLRIVSHLSYIDYVTNITLVVPTYLPLQKLQIEQQIQEGIVRYQGHRKARRSLPPLPEFPSESELNAMDARRSQALRAEIARLMGPIPDHLKNLPPSNLAERALKNLPDDETS